MDIDFVDSDLFLGEFYERGERYDEFKGDLPLIEGMEKYSGSFIDDFKTRAKSGVKHNKNHNSTKQKLLHRQGKKLKNNSYCTPFL